MKQLRKPKNVVHRLMREQLGLAVNNYRNSLETLRLIISDPTCGFVECDRIASRYPISYDESMFYLSNFKHVKLLWGREGNPSDLYKLPDTYPRFRDTISIGRNFSKTPSPRKDFRQSFFALSKTNYLYRLDSFTGEKLDEIYLGTTYKFNLMNWESNGERIVLQTPYFHKNNTRDESILQAVCLLDVFPLKFVALFELTTAVVGKEIKSANVTEGILILAPPGRVRLYDLDELIKEENRICSCNFYESRYGCTHGPIGVFPDGLPVNFRSSALPEALFDLSCASSTVEFGGYPYQRIYQPFRKRTEVHIEDAVTCQNIATLETESILPDGGQCFFHWDDSGRIIHQLFNEINIYKTVRNGQELKLQLQFCLKLESAEKSSPYSSNCNYGTRPREVRTRNVVRDYSEIYKLDYENEVEYLIILGVADLTNSGTIIIYDNETGKLTKRIPLDITLKEWCEYSLIMDIDRIIVIESTTNKTTAYVYKLDRSETG